MSDVSWPQVSARRIARHGLSTPDPRVRPADVAAAICGAHAQVLSAAELSIGLRLPGATRVDVREALWTERSLVKTRGPRGTVHLLASADLPMWTGALSAMPPPPHVTGAAALLTPEQPFRLSGINCFGCVPANGADIWLIVAGCRHGP